MRCLIATSAIVCLTSLISSTLALQAIADSPCASKCGNVLSETSGENDITCYDREYTSSSRGTVFSSCISCQLNSKYVDPRTKETDLQWALYNLRYAVSWCLYGYPNNTNHGDTPCNTGPACGTLENAFEFDSLSPNATAYGYCALLHDDVVPKCTSCTAQDDEFYITNFITTLQAACQQQPIAGATVSIEGSLFSEHRVNITDPHRAVDTSQHRKEGGLPLGAKVGIAIGAVVVFLILLGCWIVVRGKKKRRAVIVARQRQSGYADWVAAQVAQRSPTVSQHPRSPRPFHDSPSSGRALYPDPSWGRGVYENESPMSAYPGHEKSFSPYSSNYSSPISAVDQIQVVGREWPSQANFVASGVTSLHKAPTRSRSREKKEKEKEYEENRIELQSVAPVLLHPGPGRMI